MTFTIEQLEALKEGVPVMHRDSWGAGATRAHSVKADDGMFRALVGYGPDGGTAYKDAELFAASPTLLDQLIAREKANQKLREELALLSSKLGVRADNAQKNGAFSSAVAFRETAHDLIKILEGRNE